MRQRVCLFYEKMAMLDNVDDWMACSSADLDTVFATFTSEIKDGERLVGFCLRLRSHRNLTKAGLKALESEVAATKSNLSLPLKDAASRFVLGMELDLKKHIKDYASDGEPRERSADHKEDELPIKPSKKLSKAQQKADEKNKKRNAKYEPKRQS